jgi:hypothetical protein
MRVCERFEFCTQVPAEFVTTREGSKISARVISLRLSCLGPQEAV